LVEFSFSSLFERYSVLTRHQFLFQFGQQAFDPAGIPFGSQAPREYSRGSSPDWLHMQIGGSFERTT